MELFRNSFYSSCTPYSFTGILRDIAPYTVIQGELYGIYLLSSLVLTAENGFFYLLSGSHII